MIIGFINNFFVFFLSGRLRQVLLYFMHTLSLVTDSNPLISRMEENGHRNSFMLNLHESMGPGRDLSRNPWICSKTRILKESSGCSYWLYPYQVGGNRKRYQQLTNADQKSIETVFSIAICRQCGYKWQSKTLFLTILIYVP